ncbi:MAG: hypothetical protein ACK5KR_06110 [Breznakia sp.]
MSIKKQVLKFWKIFLQERSNLEHALRHHCETEQKEISKILNVYLEELCNCQLMFEVGLQHYEMIFLSGQDKNAQIICALLKKMMPKGIEGTWLVHASLPPLSEKALHTILRLEDKEYTPDNFIVYYDIDEQNKCLNLEVYCKAYDVLEKNKANEVTMYLLSLFLGDIALEAYVNQIDLIDHQKTGDSALLTQLYEVLQDIIAEYQWVDYQDATMIYRIFKIQENTNQEAVRKDIKIMSSVHPVLMSELLEDVFHSYHEFFDFGGEFGYIYYENPYRDEKDALLRQKLEKVINNMLYKHGIARSIGGAMGSKYTYIDIAVFDKEEFLKAFHKMNTHISLSLAYTSFS